MSTSRFEPTKDNGKQPLLKQFAIQYVSDENFSDTLNNLAGFYSTPNDFKWNWMNFLQENRKNLGDAQKYLKFLFDAIFEILSKPIKPRRPLKLPCFPNQRVLKNLPSLLTSLGFHENGSLSVSSNIKNTKKHLYALFSELYIFTNTFMDTSLEMDEVNSSVSLEEDDLQDELEEPLVSDYEVETQSEASPVFDVNAICFVCNKERAVLHCDDCELYFCDGCDDEFHLSEDYSSHTRRRMCLATSAAKEPKSEVQPRNTSPTQQSKSQPEPFPPAHNNVQDPSSEPKLVSSLSKLPTAWNADNFSIKFRLFLTQHLHRDVSNPVSDEEVVAWLNDTTMSMKRSMEIPSVFWGPEDIMSLIEAQNLQQLLGCSQNQLETMLIQHLLSKKESITAILPDYTNGEVMSALENHHLNQEKLLSFFNHLVLTSPFPFNSNEPINCDRLFEVIRHELSQQNDSGASIIAASELSLPNKYATKMCLQLLQNPEILEILGTCRLTYDCFLKVVSSDYIFTQADAEHMLLQECPLCSFNCSKENMCSTMSCSCQTCPECFIDHFKYIIRNKAPPSWSCPVCGEPDLNGVFAQGDVKLLEEKQAALEFHLQLLSLIVDGRHHLRELRTMFHSKVTSWKLSKDPKFLWCSNGCGNGLIYDGENISVFCQICNRYTCKLCKKLWEKEHEGKTCEEFEAWKIMQDPHIAKLMQLSGIECPNCHMRYQLVRGGCLHFTCHQCKFEFCCGCDQPYFTKGGCPMNCGFGLHAHHPRNCLFYLRDRSVDELEAILTDAQVNIETPVQNLEHCNVKKAESLQEPEVECGKPCLKADLCEAHYKEFLVHLINKNKVDPATIMDINSLLVCLNRQKCSILARQSDEDDLAYKPRLLAYLQQHLPLYPATEEKAENAALPPVMEGDDVALEDPIV